jgi:hypothetical protein
MSTKDLNLKAPKKQILVWQAKESKLDSVGYNTVLSNHLPIFI